MIEGNYNLAQALLGPARTDTREVQLKRAHAYALLAIVDELREIRAELKAWNGTPTEPVKEMPDTSWLDANLPLARITPPKAEDPNIWEAKISEREEKERHVIEFSEFGWTMQHPSDCRSKGLSGLTSCAHVVAAQQGIRTPSTGLGRYFAELQGSALLFGAPIPPRLERA